MPQDFKNYLADIEEAIQKIFKYTQNMTYEAFVEDDKTIDAVIRNLEVIGEAGRNIPEDIRHRYSEIEWKRIIGLRNILIHEYFGLSIRIIWDIVHNKLPELAQQIRLILDEQR